MVAAIGVGGPRPVEAYVGPWSPRVRLRLPVVEGPGTLSIVCIDEAGNRSVPSDIEYVLDSSAPPVGPNGSGLVINNGDSFTNERSVRLAITAVDNRGGSGLDAMAIGSDALDCADANYEPLGTSLPGNSPPVKLNTSSRSAYATERVTRLL